MNSINLKSSLLLKIHTVLVLAGSSVALAGEATPVTFHVTGVRSFDGTKELCPTKNCSATTITVEGYANSVEYVLTCGEIVILEPGTSGEIHQKVVCAHVHAHTDYPANIFPDTVAFQSGPQSADTRVLVAVYHIVSERETRK